MAATDGDFKIGGAPGTGARIDLDFRDFVGCTLGRGLLPTGSPIDQFNISKLGKLDVSVVDTANLCAFVRAADVGLGNEEGIEVLQSNRELIARLESIRSIVAAEVGFVSGANADKELRVRTNPIVFVVGIPKTYTTLNGEAINGEGTDLFSRSMTQWAFSKAYLGTGAIGTGIGCTIPRTIPAEMVRGGTPPAGQHRTVGIGHPGGTLEVEAGVDESGLKAVRAYGKSTVIRLLQTMELLDFVKQEHDMGRYELGSKVLELAQKFLEHRDDIVSLAVDQIRALWENYHETVGLYAREGDTRICIYRREGSQSLRYSVRVGQVLPLYRGASGKVFLAHMPEPEVKAMLARWNMDVDAASRLLRELPEVRRTGLAYSISEHEPGVASVAAPILDGHETIVAVLGMAGPMQRFSPDRLQELAEGLIVAAQTVSSRMVGRQVSVGSRA